MQLHEVRKLKEAKSAAEAEAAIADGWSLIAVIPNPQPTAGFGLAAYVLARRTDPQQAGGVTQADVTKAR